MPSKEKRCIATERYGTKEGLPGRKKEESDERDLNSVKRGQTSDDQLTSWKMTVSTKVRRGVIAGSTANEVSPTNPRVTLLTADWSTARPNLGATGQISRGNAAMSRTLTEDQRSIDPGIHSPYIWCPICVAKTSGEWKQSAQKLLGLTPVYKWAQCCSEDSQNSHSEPDQIQPSNVED
jgi:hypothetical protein